jgi:hypothetical protein
VADETEERLTEALGASLANLREILLPVLTAAESRHVVEVGAHEGEMTRELLDWAKPTGASVTAIDPAPAPPLLELDGSDDRLELIQETSLDALARLPLPDAVIVDGDHNHFTVLSELRLIAERAGSDPLPLIVLHDVGWPHARRDTYYAPDRIPAEHRQPLAEDALLAPGEPGTADAGIRFPWAAAREGGSANGVLTAVEDFLDERDGLRFALVPAFFGLGVLWPEDADWAGAVAATIAPWDRSPTLERLETARVACMVERYRLEQQEAVLRSLLDSRAFSMAEWASRARQRGEPAISRERVRRALGDR